MRHLNEGTLRRMYDDPHAVDEGMRAHLSRCEACQIRLGQVAGEARRAAELMQVSGVTVDAERAFRKLKPQLVERRRTFLPSFGRRPSLGWRKPAIAALAAGALITVLSASSLASTLVSLLEPQQVQAVPLTQQDLSSLAPLAGYGDVSWQTQPKTAAAGSADEAATASNLPKLNPTWLPSDVSGKPATYQTVSAGQASFTFSAAKAQAAAAKAGQAAPQFPAGADGSQLMVQSGAGQMVIYGDTSKLKDAQGKSDPSKALANVGTILAIGEMKAPAVYSNGMTLAQLKQVLLSQPGLTPAAKTMIEGLGTANATTLPIPFPVDKASSTAVTVHTAKGDVSGTMFGDNTGLGAGVIWIQDGIVHGVAGTVSQTDLQKVASGLR